ncbi:hypothetical protein ACV07N_00595 [Roseivirga echinicomitans]
MLNNILNIEGASVLNKEQQKSIIGGGECYVYRRDSNGNAIGWSGDENGNGLSVENAQSLYNEQFEFADGSYVSGYCCASCPQFVQ